TVKDIELVKDEIARREEAAKKDDDFDDAAPNPNTQTPPDTPDSTPIAPEKRRNVGEYAGVGFAEVARDVESIISDYVVLREQQYRAEGKGFLGKMWRGAKSTIVRQNLRAKYAQEITEAVRNGSTYELELASLLNPSIDRGMLLQSSKDANDAILRRLSLGVLRPEDESVVEDGVTNELRSRIKNFALRYAQDSSLGEDDITAFRETIFDGIDGVDVSKYGNLLTRIDDLPRLLRDVRADYASMVAAQNVEEQIILETIGRGLDELEVNAGSLDNSLVAKRRYSIFDKFQGRGLGRGLGYVLVGNVAMGGVAGVAAAGVITDLGRGVALSSLRSALRFTTAPIIAGAAMGAALAYSDAKERISTTRRLEAMGNDASAPDLTEAQLAAMSRKERKAYKKQKKYAESQEKLYVNRENLPEDGQASRFIEIIRNYSIGDNMELPVGVSAKTIKDIALTLSQLRLIDERSAEAGLDLLSYSDVASQRAERSNLTLERTKLQIALEKYYLQHGYETDPNTGKTMQEIISESDAQGRELNEELSDIEKDSNKAKRIQIAKKLAVGALVGGATAGLIGGGLQEGLAFVTPRVNGYLEHIVTDSDGAGANNTLLESIFNGDTQTGLSVHDPNNVFKTPDGKVNFELPQGYSAQTGAAPNTVNIVDSNGATIVSDAHYDSLNGSFDQAALVEFDSAGLNINETPTPNRIPGTTIQVGGNDLSQKLQSGEVALPSGDYHQISYNGYNTNFEPGLQGDLDELSLGKGGESGWFNQQGDVIVSINNLIPGGSFGPEGPTDVLQGLNEGRGQIFMQLDPQGNGVFFDVVSDGNGGWNAVIPNDNPLTGFFEQGPDGNYVGPKMFDYEHNSLAFVINDPDGSSRAIASIDGTDGVVTIDTPPTEEISNAVTIDAETSEEIDTIPIIAPGFYVAKNGKMPKPNEKPIPIPPTPNPYNLYGGDYGYGSSWRSEYEEKVRLEVSPRLSAGGDLSLPEESDWFRATLHEDFGQKYIDEIESIIDSAPDIKNLPPETEAIVAIPVAAAIEQENIYRTLSLYSEQQDVGEKAFTIVLGVNNIEGDFDDPTKAAAIKKTLDEIERARSTFPHLNIVVLRYEVPKDKKNIGYITRRLYDAVALSAGEFSKGNEGRDILMIRNDADALGVSPNYINRMLKAQRVMPEALAFRGETQFGNQEFFASHPGAAVTTGFAMMLISNNASGGDVFTGGANFALKSSAYCAMRGMGPEQSGRGGSDDVGLGRRLKAATGNRVTESGIESHNYTSGNLHGSEGPHSQGDVKPMDDESDQVDRKKRNRYPVRFVGAQLETSTERILGAYISGGGIPTEDAWLDYDEGGSIKNRDANLPVNIVNETFKETVANSNRIISAYICKTDLATAEYFCLRYFGSADRFIILRDPRSGLLSFSLTPRGESFIQELIARRESALSVGNGILARNLRDFSGRAVKYTRPRS
ncbi:MAG: hypothetical protein QG645_104, partial [Patescibacteria group bacterium]|nr:hypothetical protein [Patescibacteria group bacterium]